MVSGIGRLRPGRQAPLLQQPVAAFRIAVVESVLKVTTAPIVVVLWNLEAFLECPFFKGRFRQSSDAENFDRILPRFASNEGGLAGIPWIRVDSPEASSRRNHA